MSDDHEDKRNTEFDKYSFDPSIEFGYTTSNTRRDVLLYNFENWKEFIDLYFYYRDEVITQIQNDEHLHTIWNYLDSMRNRPQLIGIKKFEEYLREFDKKEINPNETIEWSRKLDLIDGEYILKE
tara:strand:- start:218 stop:592 length:375 start_codon:yes stop_codon:yes gene_type:complete